MGLEELPSRAERAVHGGAAAEPDLARLGADRDGPGSVVGGQDRPGSHDAGPGAPGTGYLLAHAEGAEFLAYQDGSQGEFWIDLKSVPGTYAVEWFDPTNGKAVAGKPIQGRSGLCSRRRFPGPAAVYLKRSASALSLCDGPPGRLSGLGWPGPRRPSSNAHGDLDRFTDRLEGQGIVDSHLGNRGGPSGVTSASPSGFSVLLLADREGPAPGPGEIGVGAAVRK